MCRNGHKVSRKFDQGSIERAPRSPYSRDISPCDFWLFGMLKRQMKDRESQSRQEIAQTITKSWDDVTFAEVQNVLWEWIERPTWVGGNNGEDYRNEKPQCQKWLNIDRNQPGRGSGSFLPPLCRKCNCDSKSCGIHPPARGIAADDTASPRGSPSSPSPKWSSQNCSATKRDSVVRVWLFTSPF
jgi:hypothetical protein